jgi:MFS family permease
MPLYFEVAAKSSNRHLPIWRSFDVEFLSRVPGLSCPLVISSIANATQPALLNSFDISAESVPYYVGVCSAIWAFTTCVTSPFWGRASDLYGRKPAIVLANILYAFGVLVFGLVGKLWLILAVMSVLGFAGGVTPVLQWVYVAFIFGISISKHAVIVVQLSLSL